MNSYKLLKSKMIDTNVILVDITDIYIDENIKKYLIENDYNSFDKFSVISNSNTFPLNNDKIYKIKKGFKEDKFFLPISVSPPAKNKYIILNGRHRLICSILHGYTKIYINIWKPSKRFLHRSKNPYIPPHKRK